MSDRSLLNEVRAKAQAWTQPPHDDDTRQTVQAWLDTCDTNDVAREALIDAFYTDLSFGTGGLRGKMGPGTNRINATTIANATQGLANHLRKMHGASHEGRLHRVAIACDSRCVRASCCQSGVLLWSAVNATLSSPPPTLISRCCLR